MLVPKPPLTDLPPIPDSPTPTQYDPSVPHSLRSTSVRCLTTNPAGTTWSRASRRGWRSSAATSWKWWARQTRIGGRPRRRATKWPSTPAWSLHRNSKNGTASQSSTWQGTLVVRFLCVFVSQSTWCGVWHDVRCTRWGGVRFSVVWCDVCCVLWSGVIRCDVVGWVVWYGGVGCGGGMWSNILCGLGEATGGVMEGCTVCCSVMSCVIYVIVMRCGVAWFESERWYAELW